MFVLSVLTAPGVQADTTCVTPPVWSMVCAEATPIGFITHRIWLPFFLFYQAILMLFFNIMMPYTTGGTQ